MPVPVPTPGPTQAQDTRLGAWRWALPIAVIAWGAAIGQVTLAGLLAAAGFIAWVMSATRLPPAIWFAGTLLGAIALAAHALPGFTPLPLAPAQWLGGTEPWQLRLGFDKAVVAATLWAWWSNTRRPTPAPLARALAVSLLAVLLIPLLALASGVLGWQPKWPADLLLPWLLVNLAVTSLAEELVFRALLQRALVARLGVVGGLTLTALLFGAAHLPFSAGFAGIAALAGLAYGAAFCLSGNRLAVAVTLHAAVNTIHLLLLTYPLP